MTLTWLVHDLVDQKIAVLATLTTMVLYRRLKVFAVSRDITPSPPVSGSVDFTRIGDLQEGSPLKRRANLGYYLNTRTPLKLSSVTDMSSASFHASTACHLRHI